MMDTSETFIKMRVAAIPDLGMGTPILSRTFVFTESIAVDNAGNFFIHCDRAPYWCQLERQDQLQEMLTVERNKTYWISTFGTFVGTVKQYPTTMEQLWLAFVQKENHNKIWDGENWQHLGI